MLNLFREKLELLLIACIAVFWGLTLWLDMASLGFKVLASGLFIVAVTQIIILRELINDQKRQGEVINKIAEKLSMDYKQIEALVSLYSTQQFSLPLPLMRGSVISPDFANIVISEVNRKKPELVVECGSGVSTIITANCLKKINRGHIFSVDHEEKYAGITRKNLQLHDLGAIATVVHAPLKETIIGSSKWLWYDTNFINKISKVDMLVVDGPPRDDVRKMVRYPALPLLIEKLADNAVVILDDAGREDEKNIVNAWLKEYKGFEYEYYPTEKGTVILRKA